MKIVVAMDSFKGSLTASRACQITADALLRMRNDLQIIQKPIADGGEGTAQAMIKAMDGTWIPYTVKGPLPDMAVDAGFAWFDKDGLALVEMASASGLTLLTPQQRNPLKTSTFGTGQLISAAIKKGAKRIMLAVGGSATVDGGTGAAAALGWKFLDKNSKFIEPTGGNLHNISKIIPPADFSRLPEIEVLCDVENRLLGSAGAAAVYGPQKGATPEMVLQLEKGLANLADIVRRQLGKDIDILYAGAAGGLAAGAVAFMNAKLVSGIDTIIKHTGIARDVETADWLITGEGSFDSQSLSGKAISGLVKITHGSKTKVIVLAGSSDLTKEQYHAYGITDVFVIRKDNMPLEYAMVRCERLLAAITGDFVKKYLMNL
jgi:glycerate 2-kinase